MYQMVQDKVCGVLNDYDLSVIHDKSRQVGDERTGTKVFMAYKLLQNYGNNTQIPHIYGEIKYVRITVVTLIWFVDFDLESFAYVDLWITARFDNGVLIKNSPLYSAWITTGSQELIDTRINQLQRPGTRSASHELYSAVHKAFCQEVGNYVDNKMQREHDEKQVMTQPRPSKLYEKIKSVLDASLEKAKILEVVTETRDCYDS